ncbi:MAG: PIN domain-containing protein [Nitrospinota bacterium]
MKQIFVDTSGWYSIVDAKDPKNTAAVKWFRNNSLPLLTTNYTFSETLTLIRYRLGHNAAITFGKKLKNSNSVALYRVTEDEEKKAWLLFEKYSDKKFSFLDCISFAVMENLKIKEAFTFDKHFKQIGFRILPR